MQKFLVTLLLTLSLAACNTDNTTPNNAKTETTKPADASAAPAVNKKYSEEYTAGIDIGSPPFSMRDELGQATGFEVEILKAIGDDQDFGISFLGEQRLKLYQDMEAGKYQIIIASLEINPDNEAKFDMTNPHAKSYRAILSRQNKRAESSADLTNGGLVGVQENTASAKLLKEMGAKTQEFSNLHTNFQSFARKETDFLVGNAVPLSHYIKQYQTEGNHQSMSDVVMTTYDNPVKVNHIAFGISKNNEALKNKINTGLANIQNNGKYDEIYRKWFGDDDIAKIESK